MLAGRDEQMAGSEAGTVSAEPVAEGIVTSDVTVKRLRRMRVETLRSDVMAEVCQLRSAATEYARDGDLDDDTVVAQFRFPVSLGITTYCLSDT